MTIHRHKLAALDFIRDYRLEHGEMPSIREIAKGIGYKSPSAAHRIVTALEADGRIRRTGTFGTARTIELVPVSAIISVELPPHLYAQVQAVAHKANVTLAAVVIEAVRDGFKFLYRSRSSDVSHETGGKGNGQEPNLVEERRVEPGPSEVHGPR